MEIYYSGQIEASQELALYRRVNPKGNRLLRYLELDWPCAMDVINNLFNELADHLRVISTPVAHRALSNGLAKYHKSFGLDDQDRLNNFIEAIGESIGHDLNDVALMDEVDNSVWDPLGERKLVDWIEERNNRIPNIRIVTLECSMLDIKAKYIGLLTNDQIKLVIENVCSLDV